MEFFENTVGSLKLEKVQNRPTLMAGGGGGVVKWWGGRDLFLICAFLIKMSSNSGETPGIIKRKLIWFYNGFWQFLFWININLEVNKVGQIVESVKVWVSQVKH